MTSAEISGIFYGNQWVEGKQVQITEGEIWRAASLAQIDICVKLRALERTAAQTIIPNKQTYTYPAMPVLGATNTSPIVMNVAGHSFQTGDRIIQANILGNTAANGEFTATKTDDDHYSLDNSTPNGNYTSGGTAYHALYSAIEIRSARQTYPCEFMYTKITYEKMGKEKEYFGAMSNANEVFKFYEIYTNPITIGFLGVPYDTISNEVRFYRIPFPHEAISKTVDPVISSRFDRQLINGTRYYLFFLRPEVECQKASQAYWMYWQNSLKEAQEDINGERMILNNLGQERMHW